MLKSNSAKKHCKHHNLHRALRDDYEVELDSKGIEEDTMNIPTIKRNKKREHNKRR